jgi:hypothetical protein
MLYELGFNDRMRDEIERERIIKAECLACCGCEDHDYTLEETSDY